MLDKIDDNKTRFIVTTVDSGNDPMTVMDMAVKLSTTRAAIHRMCKAEVQRRDGAKRLPVFYVSGHPMCKRAKFEAWIDMLADEPPVYPPEKGKKKRKR